MVDKGGLLRASDLGVWTPVDGGEQVTPNMTRKGSQVRVLYGPPRRSRSGTIFAGPVRWDTFDVASFSVAFRVVGYVRTSEVIRVARAASVRWNESAQRWMAWVRFPDGSRRKVERIGRRDAEADLNELLAQRSAVGQPLARRQRLA